jgi:RHS repeat-associated protein
MKKYILLLLFCIILGAAFGQDKVITLNIPLYGNQNIVARDAVIMNPGFSYTPSAGNAFTASINAGLILPVTYTSGDPYTSPSYLLDTTHLPGYQTGIPSVSPTGASVYEVPIFTPQGTGGMIPQLSLVYNSQTGNSILGPGFTLSGMSIISRINLPYYARNESPELLGNLDKQFALDGNRLVLISGNHAQNGAIYKTENETFSIITFFGTFGSGSEWFQVKTKDGRTIEYGNGTYSKIKPSGSTNSVGYCINKVTDQFGNYVLYNYGQISATGENYLLSIQYTGNSNTGLQPYNTIVFFYDSRTDNNFGFFKGLKVNQTLLLREIRISVSSEIIRRYRFSYYYDQYSFLEEIVEFGKNGDKIASTKIDRFAPPELPFETINNLPIGLGDKLLFPGDFNGDGVGDLIAIPDKTIWAPSDQWVLYLSSNGVLTEYDSGLVGDGFKGLTLGDFNGDGKDEVFFEYFESVEVKYNCQPCQGGVVTMQSSSNVNMMPLTLVPPPEDSLCCDTYTYTQSSFIPFALVDNDFVQYGSGYDFFNLPSHPEMRMADLDGDGKSDFLFLDSNRNVVAIRGVNTSTLPNFSNPFYVMIGDFNGNGINDILTFNKTVGLVGTAYVWEYNLSQGNFTCVDFNYNNGLPPTAAPGDFNGDGITDLLIAGATSIISGKTCLETTLLFSTGSGFVWLDGPIFEDFSFPEEPNLIIDTDRWEIELFPSDFNSDGKTDILALNKVYFKNQNGDPYPFPNYENTLHISTGSQFELEEGMIAHDFDFSHVMDYNYDGTPDFYFTLDNYGGYSLTFLKNDNRSIVKEIINSSNISTQFSYELPSESPIYTYEPEEVAYPVQHLVPPSKLVSKFEVIDRNLGITLSDTRFHYSNFKIHRQGKGLLGFSVVSSKDLVSEDESINYYRYHSTLYLPYLWKSESLKNDTPVTDAINEYTFIPLDNNRRYYSYASNTVSNNLVDNISQVLNITSDINGNITQRITKFLNSSSVEVKTVTENMSNYNNFGLPGNTSVISTSDGLTIQRDKTIAYYSNGLVKSVTSLFGTSPSVVTSFTYDDFGNKLTESINSGTVTRSNSFQYETSKARFVIRSTDQHGQNTEYTFDPITSSLIKETDFNNLTTSYSYDNLGRLTRVGYPDSTYQVNTWTWSNNELDKGELYAIRTDYSGQPTVIKYFDRFGKEVRSKTISFDGRFIITDTEYDLNGRVIAKYAPYFETDGPNSQKTIYEYSDSIGRLSKETVFPSDGGSSDSITYDYTPLKTLVTKAGRTYESEMDAIGQKIKITEPGGSIFYHYNPEGKVDRIESPSGISLIEYDDYGNQKKLIDIDAGTILYKYNGLGELLEQTDAMGNKITHTYTASGKLFTESWNTGLVKTYVYHPVNGQISRFYTSEGTEISYTYDNLIRISTITHKVDPQNTFTKAFTYNSEGKIEKIMTNSKITQKNTYNSYGYNDKIIVNDTIVWQAYSQNKNGIIDNYKVRNNKETTSLSYDQYGFPLGIQTTMGGSTIQNWIYDFNPTTGNMSSRKGLNSLGNLIEEKFPNYDNQDRLKEYKINGQNSFYVDYDGAGKGTIINKTDIGSYNYANTAHALTSITNPTSLMTTLPDQVLTYTPFNKIKTLTHTDGTGVVKQLTWLYAPDDERSKQVYTVNGQVNSTKFYAFGDFEKIITPSKTSEVYYVDSPSGRIAAIEITPTQTSYYYIHTDLIGSYDVITNHNGVIAEKNCFDPWGRRRNYYDWSYYNVSNTMLFDRGFTGHEHLLEFGLINMNGRIYDPLLAMFLSPDNFVQSPENTQNFNRYAYCLNNPLIYNDPNGEWVLTALVMVGNMWLSTSAANDFKLNPLKWDWNAKTWFTLVQSGFSGWSMGRQFEQFVKEYISPKPGGPILDQFPNSQFTASLEGSGTNRINSVSPQGISFINSWEKFLPCPTQLDTDRPGVFTVGYGHVLTPGESFEEGLTPDEAYSLLLLDIERKAVIPIIKYVKVPLTQNQFDALASYVFNVGPGNSIVNTNLIGNLNAGFFDIACCEMDIIRSAGVIRPGLKVRRLFEQLLWKYGIYINH